MSIITYMESDKKILLELLNKYNKKKLYKMIEDISNIKIVDMKPIDKTTDKYKMLLKLVNKILISIGKEEIDDLLLFKNIKREILISDTIKQIYSEMEKEIFTVFNKKECGWYLRNSVKYYILSLLRHAAKQVDLEFKFKNQCTHKNMISTHTTLYYFSMQNNI